MRDKLYEIEIVAFEMDWASPRMTCYQLIGFDACGKYELTLPTLKQSDVPIGKIKLMPVRVPEKREDGSKMDELTERTVEIHDLHEIKKVEDIQFEY